MFILEAREAPKQPLTVDFEGLLSSLCVWNTILVERPNGETVFNVYAAIKFAVPMVLKIGCLKVTQKSSLKHSHFLYPSSPKM